MLLVGGNKVAIIKQQEIHELIGKGIEKARRHNRKILVSQRMKVTTIDPLSFFSRGKKNYQGKRIYWSDPKLSVQIVGLGAAFHIKSKAEGRFTEVEQQWKSILSESIYTLDQSVLGTGPILLGGFSFDPKKTKTHLWQNYPDAAFFLPVFMLTVSHGECWLTINVVVTEEDHAAEKAEQLINEKNNLMEAELQPFEWNPEDWTLTEVEPQEWMDSVEEVTKEIQSNVIHKVVLARELRLKSNVPFSSTKVLERLREQQPYSFIFAIESGEECFLGASPERLVKKEVAEFLSTCLAGSIRRGKTINEDVKLGEILLHDKKNLIEHEVVVRMIKEAMEKVCNQVTLPHKPTLYKVRDIQHLYTPIVGTASEKTSLLEMVKQLHPTPALGGYPQKEALEKIRDVERLDRGWYSAPVGWLDYKGDGEFAAAIRSGLLRGKEASLFAGCGIVGDSDPVSEYEETKMKFQPMLSALGGIEIDS
jgi:menaquinone-specific isochorismate synthase